MAKHCSYCDIGNDTTPLFEKVVDEITTVDLCADCMDELYRKEEEQEDGNN